MSNIQPSNTDTTGSTLRRFFSNPLVGAAGSVASIAGLLLATYFYKEGKEAPQLTFYVHPVRAVVLQAGQASRLSARFDNELVRSDITAVQVAVWNRGKLAIRQDRVLKPVVILTMNHAPILEAQIRKSTREVTELSLNTTDLEKGRVTVSWRILEQNDGGVIQLIYAGGPSVAIRVDGAIEGQKEIAQLVFPRTIRSAEEQFLATVRGPRTLGSVMLAVGILFVLIGIVDKVIDKQGGRRFESALLSLFGRGDDRSALARFVARGLRIVVENLPLGLGLTAVGYAVYVLLIREQYVPPFSL